LQFLKIGVVEQLIDRCSLLLKIALNFFSFTPIFVALNKKKKKKKTYKLEK